MLESVFSSERAKAFRARWRSVGQFCGDNLNFFRVHVLVFLFTPLIFAGIFYACNTETHIKFIDCLFVCVSAMTVTGLVTFNISTANPGQQAILFFLMCIGNISAVSVVMIWIRRHFFRKTFDSVVRRSAKVRKRMYDVEEQERRERRHNIAKLQRMVGLKSSDSATTVSDAEDPDRTDSSSSGHIELHRINKSKPKNKTKRGPLRADMIRRLDGPAFLINSAGDPSKTIPDHTSTLPQNERGASATHQPETPGSPRFASTHPGVGILSTNAQQPSDRDKQHSSASDDQKEYPSIRISLPHDKGSADTASGKEDDTSPSAQAPRRRLSIPRFTSRHDPDADSDNGAATDAEIDHNLPDQPRSPSLRAHFPEQPSPGRGRRVSDPPHSHFRRGSDSGPLNARTTQEKHDIFPRAQTVEFDVPSGYRSPSDYRNRPLGYTTGSDLNHAGGLRQRTTTFNRTATGRSYASGRFNNGRSGVPLARTQTSAKQRGFGGFPSPFELAAIAMKRAMPGVQERFTRTMTMPQSATFTSIRSGGALTENGAKAAPYLSFDATVTGNSRFHALTEAQRDELGGVEYRALDLLAKLVPAYWFLVNLGIVTMVAPYINSRAFLSHYEFVFQEQGRNAPNYTWFWFFQVISAYSNTGMSLIDTSMTQMQDAYFLLIAMGFLILAGNTAFPILLRGFIWLISVCAPKESRLYETLRFLLDHPRRCFVYLFPSSQTWFLLFVLFLFNSTDWVAFLVLDLGNPVIESIKPNIRVFDGLFQSIAVRAAGFSVVSLLALAPSVQFLYVVMMYLSAFPLAMSVRSTNVYEEKSLGVYVDEQAPSESGALPQESSNPRVWGSFLASHARRQLAFDIWWLGFALWLICIIERDQIQDPKSDGWFTIFSCLFELTSAYGTVGLSLGTPYDNFSLSGRFHTLSKLVVCAVMLRGRHRGLPVAIDRAILLPAEVELEDAVNDDRSQDDAWDRDGTFVADTDADADAVAPRNSPNVVNRRRSDSSSSSSGAKEDSNGMSAVRRTMSGVSFAPSTFNARRSSMPAAAMEPQSPKQHAELTAPSETRRSFTLTLPPSSLPLHHPGGGVSEYAHGAGSGTGLGPMLVSSPGQLTAIDEMPSGAGATPLSEGGAELFLPSGVKESSASASASTHGSAKGKEREQDVSNRLRSSAEPGVDPHPLRTS